MSSAELGRSVARDPGSGLTVHDPVSDPPHYFFKIVRRRPIKGKGYGKCMRFLSINIVLNYRTISFSLSV